jgi:hypothetical protein
MVASARGIAFLAITARVVATLSQRMLFPLSLVAACSRAFPASPVTMSPAPAPTAASTPVPIANATAPPAASTGPATPPQIDPDGDDDPVEAGKASFRPALTFERVGRAPAALQRICDLTPLGDSLYAAHSNQPLGTDGATISRYRPDDPKRPFSIAFDWNRPGEPTKGGGAGQGFLRVHAIGGRLFVPDADPPYAGFGISDWGTEGFVFVSDANGSFAAARMPGHRPPGPPTPDGAAGASVLPRAYHDIDVIRFRGRLYASTGSVPPTQQAWRGPSPGALHVADDKWARWTYQVDYPFPWQNGVWRLTFLVRFRDRLYAGIQDFDGRDPNDYVTFTPPADAQIITHDDVHGVRVTPRGGALTLRWYADAGKLWWIVLERDGAGTLRVTSDGENWRVVPLPPEAGRPSDVVRFGDAVVALVERGLWRVDVEPPTLVAQIDSRKSPFVVNDAFCSAPLAVFRGELYAGGQRDGSLWKLAPAP